MFGWTSPSTHTEACHCCPGAALAADVVRYCIATDLVTVIGPPEKGGTVAERMRAAMQPPARVPEKSPPARTELVTRPDGAKVTITLAVPAGSPS